MKKLSIIVMCVVAVFFFVSCQTGNPKDINGDTPSMVVDKLYKAIQADKYDEAAAYNKIPDTIKMKTVNVYPEFKGNPVVDGKVIITGDQWKAYVIERMKCESSGYSLDSWEIVSEEISKTDPNSAKVKTKIHITTKDGESEAECSFPLKRENDVWLIIG